MRPSRPRTFFTVLHHGTYRTCLLLHCNRSMILCPIATIAPVVTPVLIVEFEVGRTCYPCMWRVILVSWSSFPLKLCFLSYACGHTRLSLFYFCSHFHSTFINACCHFTKSKSRVNDKA